MLSEPARGHAAMLGFSGLVAGSFALGRLAAPHIPPDVFNALRFVIAAASVWALVALTGAPVAAARAAPWRHVVLGGVFAFYFVAMFEALKTAGAVSLAAVFTLTPVMSAAFGYWLLRQITTARIALALSIGAAGALWVVFRGDVAALMAFDLGRGEAIYLVGSAAHALYTPLLRRLSRGEPALVANAAIHSAGAGLLLLIAAPRLGAVDWTALPGIVWLALLYTALAASALTLALLRYATLRLPSSKVMAYTYLVPSWVLIWEAGLGHGLPSLSVLAGVALTAGALVLLVRD
ncbi:DMT family transporter [Roseivivax sp. CAU 1761]